MAEVKQVSVDLLGVAFRREPPRRRRRATRADAALADVGNALSKIDRPCAACAR